MLFLSILETSKYFHGTYLRLELQQLWLLGYFCPYVCLFSCTGGGPNGQGGIEVNQLGKLFRFFKAYEDVKVI